MSDLCIVFMLPILTNSDYKGHGKAKLIVKPLSYYTLALPDDLTLWTVPAQGIRRWDEEALVYDVGYGGTVLRHYAFYHRWYAINCTLDRDGQFVTEQGPIDWCFNIDIGTPLFTRDNAAYDVDLCLDVLVGRMAKNTSSKMRTSLNTRLSRAGSQRKNRKAHEAD